MTRGEIWWADLQPPIGSRPVLLISRNASYGSRDFAIVAIITTRIRNIQTEVPLGQEEGLPRESVVNMDNLATIRKSALRYRIGSLSGPKLQRVDAALRFALGLNG